MKRAFALLLAVGLVLVAAAPVHADYLSTQLKPGVNPLKDDSVETYFDVAGTNVFQANTNPVGQPSNGTVIAGVVKINFINGVGQAQHVYAVFSQQAQTITPIGGGASIISFAPTTAPGLTLHDLTGATFTDSMGNTVNPLFAIYGNTAGYANDVLSTAGATAIGATNITDLMKYITNPVNGGTLEMAMTTSTTNDFFQALSLPGGAGLFTNLSSTLANSSTSAQFATPLFGLSVVINNTTFNVIRDTPATSFIPGTTVPVDASLTNSGAIGAGGPNGNTNPAHVPYSILNGAVTGQTVAGGGNDNGTLTIDLAPKVGVVPEPASVVLFGIGFAGLAARFLRRRTNKSAA
jgi:hypothetical protein